MMLRRSFRTARQDAEYKLSSRQTSAKPGAMSVDMGVITDIRCRRVAPRSWLPGTPARRQLSHFDRRGLSIKRRVCSSVDAAVTGVARDVSIILVGATKLLTEKIRQVFLRHGLNVNIAQFFRDSVRVQKGHELHDFVIVDRSAFSQSRVGVRFEVIEGSSAALRPSKRTLFVNAVEQLPGAIEAISTAAPVGAAPETVLHKEANVQLLNDLLVGLPGAIYQCDLSPPGRVSFVSRGVLEMLGHGADHFKDRPRSGLEAVVHPQDKRRLRLAMLRGKRAERPFELEHRVLCADNVIRWVHHRGAVVESGTHGGRVLNGFVIDITEKKLNEERLTYLANHDPLTGLANRALFKEHVEASINRAIRYQHKTACLFIDLDRFKRVNDSFGHDFGDRLLVAAANRLRQCVRLNDVVGRLGGDEFIVLLDGINDAGDAAIASRKILGALGKPFRISGQRLSLGVSIGISMYPEDAHDAQSLLKNADTAMYNIKKNGRNNYRFYSIEMARAAHDSLTLATDLRSAIDKRELSLVYQPRIDLVSARISGFESLVRWNSASRGPVAPGRFIPLAEETGVIEQLGEWVLREACMQAKIWNRRDQPPTRVSVNISPRQFQDQHLARTIRAILLETGLRAELLELEITENAMMRDHQLAADILQDLEGLGVRLAVDDFGTGYSSMSYLKKFPVHYLKIDQDFISGIPGDEDDVAITEAIIAMGKRLDLRVVAEGIETEGQGIFVRANGCDEGQGFLFSVPLTPEKALDFMKLRAH